MYFEKLVTVIRARFYELKQTLFSQSNTFTVKDIFHCEQVIQQLRGGYADLKAEVIYWQQKTSLVQASIYQQASAREAALTFKQDILAGEIAKSLVEKKCTLSKYSDICASLQNYQLQQKQLIVALIKKRQLYRLELRLVKVMSFSQQATHRYFEHSVNSSGTDKLANQLQAIKLKQNKIFDQITAMELLEHELYTNIGIRSDRQS